MNTFLNGMKDATNYTYTENGALTHKSTRSGLCDFFALGAAYRTRSDEDCILLFKNAYEEDPIHALKCLFYMRDIRGGQGERRFFRVVYRWLIKSYPTAAQRNLKYIPEYGRWDDLIYICYNTKMWENCIEIIKNQLMADSVSVIKSEKEGISLLAKWMPSINASSAKTKKVANCLRQSLQMTHKQYRKTLSVLRDRINVLERLMSAGRWDEIEFDKIPSKAGFKYRNAFARHDLERAKSEKDVRTYEDFMSDKETKVNAKDLYPYEIVDQAINLTRDGYSWWSYHNSNEIDPIQRNVVNKYWDNFLESIDDLLSLDALAVVDTSGSMLSGGIKGGTPMDVAISLGMCLAEKARGPFAGHYISFSSKPQLIKIEGIDFIDKVFRIYQTNLCENTNIEATFDMMLRTAIKNNCSQDDLPECLVIISDMQFDVARGRYYGRDTGYKTLMENIEAKWNAHGYKMPRLVFWNVNAKNSGGNIPMEMKEGITFVSGMSPSIFQQLCSGKTALEFVLQVLDSERYAVIK